MASCAGAQGAGHSWEVVSDADSKGSWHVGEHDAVCFEAEDATLQSY
jgi:hypothetical protein